ncbi:histamine H2 receptor-like [Uloborus diversus]|uniref:histamine H2 receptor-like n=1 Tax=Uloborus diversus TaxID=327109 RepID=UPI00240984AB|nr:histamine H2 receptor-like [Uloborus diversus]
MDNLTLIFDDYSITPSETYRRGFWMRIFGSFFTLSMGIMSVLGNLVVVLTYFWDETLRKATGNLFLVSLSIIDAVTGLFGTIPLSAAIACDYWPFGDRLCKFHNGIYYSCTSSSSLHVLLISIDRAIAVTQPLRYPDIVSPRRALLLCALLFCNGACVMIAVMVFDFSRYHYSEGTCVFDSKIYETRFMSIPSIFAYYFVTAVGIGICNSLIVFEVVQKKKNKLFIKTDKVPGKDSYSSRLNKTILSMIAIAVVFYVTTFPYAILEIVDILSDEGVSERLNYSLSLLTYLCPAVNPFIYGILRKDYRNAYKNFPRVLMRKIRGLD